MQRPLVSSSYIYIYYIYIIYILYYFFTFFIVCVRYWDLSLSACVRHQLLRMFMLAYKIFCVRVCVCACVFRVRVCRHFLVVRKS